MISSLSQENEVLKWLLSEIINFHTKGIPVNNKYARLWASKTRMHKFIYSILEKFNLNVTRSLYMWGGFVHSEILGDQYSRHRSYYHANPELAVKNRETVREYGIPVKDILEYLIENEPKITQLDSMKELQYYYIENIPEEYNSLYTSKQFITVDLSNLTDYDNIINPPNFFSLSDDLSNNFSTYHLSSVNLIEDNRIIETNYNFTNLIETSLDKIKYYLYNEEKILKRTPQFFKKADNFFTQFAWRPYACRVSQETVKGIRAETEKDKMRRIEETTIEKIPSEYLLLKELNEENRLSMSWDEYQFLKSKEEHEDYETTINEIIKLYQKPYSE